jgi:hypothetical protein
MCSALLTNPHCIHSCMATIIGLAWLQGARVAASVAAEVEAGQDVVAVAGCLMFSYPVHPPGKPVSFSTVSVHRAPCILAGWPVPQACTGCHGPCSTLWHVKDVPADSIRPHAPVETLETIVCILHVLCGIILCFSCVNTFLLHVRNSPSFCQLAGMH